MDGAIVFVIGLMVGSFLNVCICRMPKKESIVMPPSHCTACNKNILWYDNIPVLSYILLGGKCRFCKARISLRYVIVEVLTASLLVLLFLAFRENLSKFFGYSILACGLIISTFIDFEITEIPDEISLGGLAAGFIFAFAFPALLDAPSRFSALIASFIGAVAGGGSIYLMGLLGKIMFRKEAMGGGDVKLMAMIGAFLGWKLAILTFFIAPVFGAAVGIALKIKDGREIIPYGPHLSLAAIVAIFWGEKILNLFFNRLY
ncbi:MAG: prepilin peptidase [Candidatus Omnitrophota bacterium]|nr:prepilin peptidase [Candidatus Omnitrophota bacterium]